MFDKVKKNFGFGCMRLKMTDDNEVDYGEFCKMIDMFLAEGFNYFDTAHGYIEGKSETAIHDCLVSRYPRESFVLTDKLSENYFRTAEDIPPLLDSQLAACGVEYFDFYLMHSQHAGNYGHYKKCRAYEQAQDFIRQGKIRHLGISFHDSAAVLDKILTENPQVEVVQIQFNYLDYDDPAVQSKACYDVCRKHDKPVIVMEPVKGGRLVNLPEEAAAVFKELGEDGAASYAIRYAASFEGVFMVLSGMGSAEMMRDNLSHMKNFRPVNEKELQAIARVKDIYAAQPRIGCSGCRYCTEGCPKNIPIPDLFDCMNAFTVYCDPNAALRYETLTRNAGKASDCIKCGKCEKICPQHLPVRDLLGRTAAQFEKNKS